VSSSAEIVEVTIGSEKVSSLTFINSQMMLHTKHQNIQKIMTLPKGQDKVLETNQIANSRGKLSDGEFKTAVFPC
jgi:hypothetical protein